MIGSVAPENVRRPVPVNMSSRNALTPGMAGLQPDSKGAMNGADTVTAPVDCE